MTQVRTSVVVALGIVLICRIALLAASPAATPPKAAVAAAHPAATAAGREILAQGGNAFDAAIAVSAALAVVEPQSSGIGGGGFYLLHRAAAGKTTFLDAREKAPAAATHDMYLDSDGEFVRERALNGPLAAGIPGIPAALVYLAEHFGRLPLAVSLAPAIKLAKEGFLVTPRYQRLAGFRRAAFAAAPHAAQIFLGANGDPAIGARIVQTDLANTLALLAKHGHAGFYRGELAERLVSGVKAGGGIWTLEDLAAYRVVEREPIRFRYQNASIVSAPPPSSGGVVMAEAFHVLSVFDLASMDSDTRRHVVIEAMRRAYRDRAKYLGDPDHVAIPLERLTSAAYGQQLAADLSPQHATPSADLPPLDAVEGEDTTHFSVLDTAGNRVAATLSVNYPFGAAYVPMGTGVLLNNEMDDFSAKPLTPNVYGLVGLNANAIAPGKRPLSSMTPTFIERDGQVGVLGTPGGSRIITMVMIGILEFLAGKQPAEWVAAKRYHHQYLPDEVQFEQGGLSQHQQDDLTARGHTVRELTRRYGNMQAILWDRKHDRVYAASDPRGEGDAAVFKIPPAAVNVDSADNRNSSVAR